ncbi:PIKFYVE [Cordylochernes scorpioides]|uniref:PIKFYVE n=1 Tax=Cordylochernes scorpioides TaxID=51811 RepID=A0ABY6L195_9ARAC|nr:PIKFYVE [Cordylochernes scorpioides]
MVIKLLSSRIPGGTKADCEILKGVAWTKNVAHRKMRQDIPNPTILLLSTPIVYQRTENKLSSLEPIIMQLLTLTESMRMVGIHNSPVQGKIKTLLIFDGCHTEQGCTILLRGGSLAELKRVKKIVQFLLYTAYNWRLEKSFLMDEYAMPPLGSEDMVADEFQSSSVTSREVVTNVVRPAELEISHSTSHLELVRDEAAKTIEKKYVEDFSDPLRSYLQMEEDLGAAAVTSPASSHSLLRVASMPLTSQFRKGLDGTILCCSPFITVALPYLETEPGKCCKLRPFFPEEIYWSRQFQKEAAVRKSLIMEESSENQEAPVLGYEECPPHPFVHKMLSEPLAKSTKIQCMLAEFRACGEKYRRVWHTVPNSNCDGSRHKALESTNYNDCPLDKYAGHVSFLIGGIYSIQ